MSKQIAIIRFGFATKTIGEHGSPLQYNNNIVPFIKSDLI